MSTSPIISVHVHKTAGRSFNLFLKETYGSRLHRVHGDKTLTAPYRFRQRFGLALPKHEPEDINPETACIHGHYKATRWRSQFPESPLVIWLRDPMQRSASHYYFLRRHSRWFRSTPLRLLPEELGLRWYLTSKPHGDLYASVLDGIPVQDFAFVGLTEQFSRGLRLYRKIFQIEGEMTVPQENLNPDKAGKAYCFSASLVELYQQHHQSDLKIYAQAKQRFEQLCEHYHVS